MLSVLKEIFFVKKKYLGVCIVAVAVYICIHIIEDFSFIKSIIGSNFSITGKLSILSDSLFKKSIPFVSKQLLASDLLIITSSILFGILVALLREFLKKTTEKRAQINSLTFWGTLFSALGLGCLACGPTVLAALLSSIGGISLITLFPFHGLEFTIMGNILLCFAIFTITKQLKNQGICTL